MAIYKREREKKKGIQYSKQYFPPFSVVAATVEGSNDSNIKEMPHVPLTAWGSALSLLRVYYGGRENTMVYCRPPHI